MIPPSKERKFFCFRKQYTSMVAKNKKNLIFSDDCNSFETLIINNNVALWKKKFQLTNTDIFLSAKEFIIMSKVTWKPGACLPLFQRSWYPAEPWKSLILLPLPGRALSILIRP